MRKTIIYACILAAAAPCAFARIGENKNALENRLLSKTTGGLEYETKEFREREALELPYRDLLLIFPRDTAEGFYFSRLDGKKAIPADVVKQDALNGWEIHICYYKGVSVLEFYRKRGAVIFPEEAAAIMSFMKNEGASWTNAKPPAKPQAVPAEEVAKIMTLLPKPKARVVQLEVPEDVRGLPEYKYSIQSKIITEEQRKAYDAYRAKYTPTAEEKKKAEAEAKKQAEKEKKDRIASRFQNTSKDDEKSIAYGDIPKEVIDKSVRLMHSIPAEDDSAIGYNLRLNDDSVRAKLYSDGILFIDARYDKLLRDELERLFSEQENERKENCKASVTNF